MIVAVKLDVVKGCRDAVPAWHGGGLDTANVGHGDHHNVAQAQRLADENDFELDGGADGQLPRAEKIDAGGTDVARDQGYRGIFGNAARTAKAKRKVQRSTRIFAMFRVDAYGMSWNADKTARLAWTEERLNTKAGKA